MTITTKVKATPAILEIKTRGKHAVKPDTEDRDKAAQHVTWPVTPGRHRPGYIAQNAKPTRDEVA